jgi:hypothetical protein
LSQQRTEVTNDNNSLFSSIFQKMSEKKVQAFRTHLKEIRKEFSKPQIELYSKTVLSGSMIKNLALEATRLDLKKVRINNSRSYLRNNVVL